MSNELACLLEPVRLLYPKGMLGNTMPQATQLLR